MERLVIRKGDIREEKKDRSNREYFRRAIQLEKGQFSQPTFRMDDGILLLEFSRTVFYGNKRMGILSAPASKLMS